MAWPYVSDSTEDRAARNRAQPQPKTIRKRDRPAGMPDESCRVLVHTGSTTGCIIRLARIAEVLERLRRGRTYPFSFQCMPSCGRTPPVANESLGPVSIESVFTAPAALGAFILCVQVHEDRLRVEVEEEIENLQNARAAFVALTLRDYLAVLRFDVPVKLAVLFLPVLEADRF